MERTLALLLVFFTSVTSGQDNVCLRPVPGEHIEIDGLQRFFSPGAELALSCEQGYTPISGPRKVVCTASGEWTRTKLLCMPKRCPYPEPLSNGELYYEDTVYQSTINYTCHDGYTLTGPSTAECLANGTWSTSVPECKPVTCALPPIPEFGMVTYDRRIRGNTTDYGVRVTFKCNPPHILIGESRAQCTASGTWTEIPKCQVVTCPPPENINRGYMSSNDQREYDFMETVNYDCLGSFVLEGSFQIFCQKDGTWSEKPSCKSPCNVDINRARILYRDRKIWIKDLPHSRVSHNDIISVYCMDKARNCGYAVPTQCIDGKLKIPDCFTEPSLIDYSLHSGSLPSEITQC
ncbi:beta-2-glycoprotein 1-like [Chelmon rostratus]|uniref:beta-2-glycoprotein 1-like n=1 Tax=Chelmon rostratus TaxID=109905 RepID=UPI001BE69258|nr:beta-2-glycoprotein 1-like [Chelmon rostratus]